MLHSLAKDKNKTD